MTHDKNNFCETQQALVAASKLLTRLCNSRKAATKLPEITSFTGQVARLTRALVLGAEQEDGQDGYGDKDHFRRISVQSDMSGVTR